VFKYLFFISSDYQFKRCVMEKVMKITWIYIIYIKSKYNLFGYIMLMYFSTCLTSGNSFSESECLWIEGTLTVSLFPQFPLPQKSKVKKLYGIYYGIDQDQFRTLHRHRSVAWTLNRIVSSIAWTPIAEKLELKLRSILFTERIAALLIMSKCKLDTIITG
jgi:hypothetical protein